MNVLCQLQANCYRFLTRGTWMGFKRKSSRVEVGKPGRLHRGSLSAPCRIVNVSEDGMRIESRLFVKNGDALHLSIELEGGGRVACDIQVINVRAPHFGAKIRAISPEDKKRLAHILDDHLQSSFSRR
jgi:PilZ domain-containing protein